MSAAAVTTASVPSPPEQKASETQDARWEQALGLPCRLTVDVMLPNLKVSDFLQLNPGAVVTTGWGIARDLPLRVNGILVGWGELEGAGTRLAVRVTELA